MFRHSVVIFLLASCLRVHGQTFSSLAESPREALIQFEGKRVSIDEYLSIERVVIEEKQRWWKRNDPRSRLSLADYEMLFGKNIEMSVHYDGARVKVDAFGLRAVPSVRTAKLAQWSRLVRETNEELLNQTVALQAIYS